MQRQRMTKPTIKSIQTIENAFICEMNSGFVIVPSDDQFFPVIGYAEHNSMKVIPTALKSWLKQYNVSENVRLKRRKQPHPMWKKIAENSIHHTAKSSGFVLPLIATQWNQNSPWNDRCPIDISGPGGHSYAGCVAVAMAQIMNYWGFPEKGTGAHSYVSSLYGELKANFETYYAWGNMPDTTANDSVKTLLYHCGISVNMNYGPDSSSANSDDMPSYALTHFFKYEPSIHSVKKSEYTYSEWTQLLKEELSQKRPIFYYGFDSNYKNGHAFVCDGYESNEFFHFNWGWGGSYDGYFSLNDLTPDHDNDFTYRQGALLQIEPAAPVNLTLPYEENFEGDDIPSPWIVTGDHAYVGLKEAHSGIKALLLNDYTTMGTGTATALLKINVPDGGSTLKFYVKRGYSPSVSEFNYHKAEIHTEFGNKVLHRFFDGDYNDSDWQLFTLDLTPWQSENITLYFEQTNLSTEKRQWMSIDDVSIKQLPVANFNADKTVSYVNQSIQFTNLSTLSSHFLWQFGDGETSMERQPAHQYHSAGCYSVTLIINNGDAHLVKDDYIHVLPQYTPPYMVTQGGNFESQSYDFASAAINGFINIWEHGTPGNILNTTRSGFAVWKTLLLNNIVKDNYTCALMTPLFDLSEPGTYAVQFYHQMDTHYLNCPGAAWMEYTTDNGKLWKRLGTYENNPYGSENWYNKSTHDTSLDNGPCWWKDINSWTCARLLIPELVGEPSVGFRFVYRVESGWGGDQTYLIDGWSIDDFELQHIPPKADFDHPTVAYIGQPVLFKDKSIYATSWRWSFGDQTISTDQYPFHAYQSSGFYTISLQINDGDYIATREKAIHVLPERGIPYFPEKGGNFDTQVDDFDSQSIKGSIDIWEHGHPTYGQSSLQSDSDVWKTQLNDTIPKGIYQCALYSPHFKLTQDGLYILNFDLSMDVAYANGPFSVQCQFSLDNGVSWTRLGEDNDQYGQNWYNRGPSSEFKIDSGIFNDQTGWTTVVNNMPVTYRMSINTSITTQIAFRFVFSVVDTFIDGYKRDGFMIDNFSFTGRSSEQPDMLISYQYLNVSAETGLQQISIKNLGEKNLDWQIVNTFQWINVQPTSGQNDAVVTIAFDQNLDIERSGYLTFIGENALNGIQSVYIVQDAAPQAPVISVIDDITLAKNSTGDYIYLSIADEKTPVHQLNLWANSNNETLIPNNYKHLTIGGTVEQRHLFVVPSSGHIGKAIISIFAQDSDGLIAQRDFSITVQKDFIASFDVNHNNVIDINDIILALQILSGASLDVPAEETLDLALILQLFEYLND